VRLKLGALIALIIAVVGLAYWIEVTVRPDTGREGVRVEGGHEH